MKKLLITAALFIGFLFVNCTHSFGQETKEYMTIEYFLSGNKYNIIDAAGVETVETGEKYYDGLSVVLDKINDLSKEGWYVSHYGYALNGSGGTFYSYLLERDL